MIGPARVWVVLNAKGRAFALATSEPPSQVFKDGEKAIAYIPADAAADWKPIETAPQDGTRVLLWNTEDGGYAITGAWRADSAQDHESYTHWAPLPAGPEIA